MLPENLRSVPPSKFRVDLSGGIDNFGFSPDPDDQEGMKAAMQIAVLQLLQSECPTMCASNSLGGKSVKVVVDIKTGLMSANYTDKT